MIRLRRYGGDPFRILVIHGGPGDSGSLGDLAQKISDKCGVLEPMQTASTLNGLLREIDRYIEIEAHTPVILIGHSFGAWLAYIYAAQHPDNVAKIILIGSGPFKQEYYRLINQTRLERLPSEDRSEFNALLRALSRPDGNDMDTMIENLGRMVEKTDNYDIKHDSESYCESNGEMLVSMGKADIAAVLNEVIEMRKSGALISLATDVKCPVVAIHGDYDPHPADGIEKPLSAALSDFKFVLLEKCGHWPWKEINAQEEFFEILKQEIFLS